MSKVSLNGTCPHCNKKVILEADVNMPTTMSSEDAPKVRGGITPVGTILEYRINSKQIEKFIIEKARQYCHNVRIEIATRYCEKKRRSNTEPHHSYASFRIAFSEEVLEKNSDYGWYEKIGESNNVRFQQTIFQNLIHKYSYEQKFVDEWLKSYKNLEELEDRLGMTEAYINDIRQFSRPQKISSDNQTWIIFAAASEKIIMDMLTEPSTNVPVGRIQIQDVYQINNDTVEFIIYVHPSEIELRDNPHVRQILMGEKKPKR